MRQRGEAMNLLTDDIEDIAEVVKLRLMRNKASLTVYVAKDGDVKLERTHDARRAKPLPDADIVAAYTGSVPVTDIEDDLVARLNEIRRAA